MDEYFLLLRRHLAGTLPEPQWPADMRLEHYRDELAPAIHALLLMGQAQGGGRVAPLEQWRQQFVTDPECDPTLCIVARNANGVVGVAQCWTSAYIKNLVIHPGAQGQGLGRALLLQAFQVFQRRREGFVDLKVLETNLRARRLYESAGMVFVLRDLVPE